jgi:hypothetical protein
LHKEKAKVSARVPRMPYIPSINSDFCAPTIIYVLHPPVFCYTITVNGME